MRGERVGDNLSLFLISEDNTEHLAPEAICEPLVLEHSDLERLTAEDCVKVGVNRPAHPLQYNQVSAMTTHHFTQVKVDVPANTHCSGLCSQKLYLIGICTTFYFILSR